MQYKGMNLCDFCFTPVAPGTVCQKCGLDHQNYQASVGLLTPGTNLLGKYIIGRVLGRGGFGATYLAYSSDLDRTVAIKEYFPTGIAYRGENEGNVCIVSNDQRTVFEKGAKRFYEEAQTMSRFNTNKNVVSVYEFFYANDTVYYSMEYLEGIDLKGYISRKGGRLSEAEAVTVMRGVCDALVAIHSTGTLHRDVSPDNIFICTDGTVKLIDFGAAKQVVGEQAQKNYSVVVKQGFAPPEQYQSSGKQGMWTDIYAVGATIYYALTGKIPTDAMNRVENPEINFDPELNLSLQLTEILKKCLQSKIEKRYQSAIELLGALEGLNMQPVTIGGVDYVQPIYNGVAAFDGNVGDAFTNTHSSVNMQSGYNPYIQPNPYPPSQYPNSQYPNSQYPNSQYPNSQYTNSQLHQEGEKSGMAKGIIIGAAALIILILLIVVIVKLVSGNGMPPPPPQGPWGPGGPPPMGQQMPPPPQ